jgi:hypothetical protein
MGDRCVRVRRALSSGCLAGSQYPRPQRQLSDAALAQQNGPLSIFQRVDERSAPVSDSITRFDALTIFAKRYPTVITKPSAQVSLDSHKLSASGPKQTSTPARRHVCLGPIASVSPSRQIRLTKLQHFGGAESRCFLTVTHP